MSPAAAAAHLDAMSTLPAPEYDSHLALGLAESAACAPTAWERWIDDVEILLGHDADGNQDTDGYSLDAFVMLWESGRPPTQAIAEVGQVAL